MKARLNVVDRNNIEFISIIECYGTWVEERYVADKHNSFDIWEYNGNYYKIYKDSKHLE